MENFTQTWRTKKKQIFIRKKIVLHEPEIEWIASFCRGFCYFQRILSTIFFISFPLKMLGSHGWLLIESKSLKKNLVDWLLFHHHVNWLYLHPRFTVISASNFLYKSLHCQWLFRVWFLLSFFFRCWLQYISFESSIVMRILSTLWSSSRFWSDIVLNKRG